MWFNRHFLQFFNNDFIAKVCGSISYKCQSQELKITIIFYTSFELAQRRNKGIQRMIKPFTRYQHECVCTIHTREKNILSVNFRAHKRTRIAKRTTSVFRGITFALNIAAIWQIHGCCCLITLVVPMTVQPAEGKNNSEINLR